MIKVANRFVAALAACTLLAAPALANTPQSAKLAAASPVRPALWKVSDTDTTLYLFGTIHALPTGINWLEGAVAKAFNGSDMLVTEIPEVNPAQMQSVVMKTAILPAGQRLRALLPPKDKILYERALKDFGIPVESFDRFEPWFAAITLASLPMVKMGYQASSGVEAQLGEKAKAAKRPHEGLETVEYQLGLFDKLPQKVQVKYLHEVLNGMPKMSADLTQLVKFWSAGKPDKLATLMNAEESDPALIDALLYNRNRNWSKWIKTRLAEPGSVFIAVGAGHLAGKGSVQQQLAKAGLKAVRIQ